jgi:adenosylhomocysteinase
MRPLSLVKSIFNRTPVPISLIGQRHLAPGTHHLRFRLFHSRHLHQPLWDAYERPIPLKDRYCLHQLEQDWAQRMPLKGKVVLINVHLTRITLALVTALLKSGAQVEVTVSPELVTHQNALQPLLAAKIPFYASLPEEKKQGYYDIIYDCGAGMKAMIANDGMVELTQTHPRLYQHLTFPVITVDGSKTKVIETGLGTGDSFVRVIHHLARQAITTLALNWKNLLHQNTAHPSLLLTTLLSLVNVDQLFSQNKFMIFGFGKVGKGIASALESAGTPKQNIMVVDISPEAYLEAMKQGYSGLLLESRRPDSIQEIKKILPAMWAVVTATGVEGAISHYFSQSDFDHVPLLANISTGDDFGFRFARERILNHKKPINFMLDYPTEVMYLDAIFTLFLQAGEELLINKTLKKGLNPISSQLDQAVLTAWITHHGDRIWRHRLGKLHTEKLIQHLRQYPTKNSPDLVDWMENQGIFHRSSESKLFPDSSYTPRC